ncbi:MAG: adenylate kinase [Halobacteriaceae archaeon]
MGVTVVSGIPGVGASKVCEEARRELGDEYTLVNTGDVMLEAALERGLASSREGLAELPLAEQRVLQRRAGEYIRREARDGPVIANTHLVVQTPYGFLPGLPGPVLADVDPTALLLVEAEATTICERREQSDYRDYPEATELMVTFHQQLSRAAAMGYSMRAGIPVQLVPNEGALADAVESMVAAIERSEAAHPP